MFATEGTAYADTYTALSCVNSPYNSNIHLCLYQDNQSLSILLGELGNGTSAPLSNVLSYQLYTTGRVFACNGGNYTVTSPGGINSCFDTGYTGAEIRLCDTYAVPGSQDLVCTPYVGPFIIEGPKQ